VVADVCDIADKKINWVLLSGLDEYCKLPIEAAEYTDQVPAAWPHAGRIEVDSELSRSVYNGNGETVDSIFRRNPELSIQYAPGLPTVLHDLSFVVEPGQKIGIVGTTGSGKS
jgi:ABC-type multidrug transport system fused ATPase/permease subunit